tara:strand:- start:90 stop:344 length:255 start_codon:yes stop_codon:yes gene_type:complete
VDSSKPNPSYEKSLLAIFLDMGNFIKMESYISLFSMITRFTIRVDYSGKKIISWSEGAAFGLLCHNIVFFQAMLALDQEAERVR